MYEVEKFVSREHLNVLHYMGPPGERNRQVTSELFVLYKPAKQTAELSEVQCVSPSQIPCP